MFVYSSYDLKSSFPHLEVILTTLETPNIKTATKQVWLYFIHRTTQPRYSGTTTNLQVVLNTQKNSYLNQATQKNTCQIFLPKKILRSSPSLEIRSTPSGPKTISHKQQLFSTTSLHRSIFHKQLLFFYPRGGNLVK